MNKTSISEKFEELQVLQEEHDNTMRFIETNMRHLNDNTNAYYRITKKYQKISIIVSFGIGTLLVLGIIMSVLTTVNSINSVNANMSSLSDNLANISSLLDNLQIEISELNVDVNELQDEVDNLEEIITDYMVTDSENTEASESVELPSEETQVTVITYNTTDFTHKSGFSAEQFNEIIKVAFATMGKKDTALIGIGDGLYQAEQKYDVNGLYMLGIASLESGWGTSNLATKHNNVYGLVGMSFDSYCDGSVNMGRIMRTSYFDKGYNTWDKFQSKYCPSGGSKWIYNIKWCTNKYITAANELYSQS